MALKYGGDAPGHNFHQLKFLIIIECSIVVCNHPLYCQLNRRTTGIRVMLLTVDAPLLASHSSESGPQWIFKLKSEVDNQICVPPFTRRIYIRYWILNNIRVRLWHAAHRPSFGESNPISPCSDGKFSFENKPYDRIENNEICCNQIEII